MGVRFKIVVAFLLVGCVLAHRVNFVIHEVVPDVIPIPPRDLLTVVWTETAAVAQEGNVLFNTQLQEQPDVVVWQAQPDKYYSLLMTDADAPGREDRSRSEVRHWVVVNIPGHRVDCGLVLASYIGPRGVQGMGLHRYIFLTYEQPQGYIDPELFDETWITDLDEVRSSWSLQQFVQKYDLKGPIAGNFFQSEWLD